jgi:hypothetical protein
MDDKEINEIVAKVDKEIEQNKKIIRLSKLALWVLFTFQLVILALHIRCEASTLQIASDTFWLGMQLGMGLLLFFRR